MTNALVEALLDSYTRNNIILLNLLKALPQGIMDAKAVSSSATIAVQFSHIHQTRFFWLEQVAPKFSEGLASLFQEQDETRMPEYDLQKIMAALNNSAKAIADAVKSHIETNTLMKGEHASYDHPILFLQHMLWHEGYHVGQIKLALKAEGHVFSDEQEEITIWSLWRTEVW